MRARRRRARRDRREPFEVEARHQAESRWRRRTGSAARTAAADRTGAEPPRADAELDARLPRPPSRRTRPVPRSRRSRSLHAATTIARLEHVGRTGPPAAGAVRRAAFHDWLGVRHGHDCTAPCRGRGGVTTVDGYPHGPCPRSPRGAPRHRSCRSPSSRSSIRCGTKRSTSSAPSTPAIAPARVLVRSGEIADYELIIVDDASTDAHRRDRRRDRRRRPSTSASSTTSATASSAAR